VTSFFIPGLVDDLRVAERTYADMRDQIEVETGRCPSTRRILGLWTRRGRIDCVTEVGERDPLRGGTVMAIFDMGPHQPFIVWREADGTRNPVRETLGCNAYAVMEFDL
jgi:hypothetical protein